MTKNNQILTENINEDINEQDINEDINEQDINKQDNVKKMINDLNISVQTYHDFMKSELEKYKEEQNETTEKINKKIDELNQILEPQWKEETNINKEQKQNEYNAFWKGE